MLNIIENDIKNIIKSVNLGYFKKKKILIFGSSGVIGQYFLILFINLFKNKFSPNKVTLITKNKIPFYLDFLKKNKKITIINCNISEFDFTKIKRHDVIIFAGGYGQPSKFLQNPIETINLNTKILIKFISKLKKGGKFLFISSSEIYNGNNKKKLTEKDIGSTNTDDPRGCYIEAKRCGEAIINAYNKEFKINPNILDVEKENKEEEIKPVSESESSESSSNAESGDRKIILESPSSSEVTTSSGIKKITL